MKISIIESPEQLGSTLKRLENIKIKDIACVEDAMHYYQREYNS